MHGGKAQHPPACFWAFLIPDVPEFPSRSLHFAAPSAGRVHPASSQVVQVPEDIPEPYSGPMPPRVLLKTVANSVDFSSIPP
ncbi:hypothetical protein BX600DRAFT_471531 [Xylariales sp. PMI_506]|nr:hypothetical protein BX600DRAFT_471531 [Xylariales sp. PMI_506]